ncbi:hypothetical protein GGI12_003938 [Dipsacomyces acuminosporus]|nr:hypothetical protein GGI12_003938 [Dipsacomyces acuminosporus]
MQVTLPNTHTEWQVGEVGVVRWKAIDGTLKGNVSIELMEGSDPSNMESVRTIAENIPANNKQVNWNIPKNLKSSSSYAIKIVDDEGEEYYGRYFKAAAGAKADAGKKPEKSSPETSAKEAKPAANTQGAQAMSQQSPASQVQVMEQSKSEEKISKPMKKAESSEGDDAEDKSESTNSSNKGKGKGKGSGAAKSSAAQGHNIALTMKLAIAAIAAFASSAFAALSINNPVAGTKWGNATPVTVTWINDNGSALTGTVTVQLMRGNDPNNLTLVSTIADNVPASTGKVSYTPPSTLPGGENYTVRVTSSVDGPHYSHFFTAGNPAVTAEPATTAVATDSTAAATDSTAAASSSSAPKSKSKSSAATTELGSLTEDATTSHYSTKEKSSKAPSTTSKAKPTSSAEHSSAVESLESVESQAPSSSKKNSAARPILAAGALGVAALAAMF